MPKKLVVIRVNGDLTIGMGHVYRGIAIAEILKNEFSIRFLVNYSTITLPIKHAGFEIETLPEAITLMNEPSWFEKKFSTNSIVVLDGYNFDTVYQIRIKKIGYILFYIDDLIHRTQVADVVINHSPGVSSDQYETSPNTHLALGLRYPLIRKSFSGFDRTKRRNISGIHNVLISFGGSDPGSYVIKCTEQVLRLVHVKNIHVLGVSNHSKDVLESWQSSNIKVHQGLSENQVFELMKIIDLAIVPSSTISIELAALGVPMILGYFIENQKSIYAGFQNKNAVLTIGDYRKFDFNNLRTNIKSFITDSFLNDHSVMDLFQGNVQFNVLNLFRFENINVRLATRSDLMFVYKLANEPLVRANSFNSNEIHLEQHKEWYIGQLKDQNCNFFIIEYNQEYMGQVRFNADHDSVVISISITEQYRGTGLASEVLKRSVSKYYEKYDKPIFAYVKTINHSSAKSFERAGFSFYNNKTINGEVSIIYKMDKSEYRGI